MQTASTRNYKRNILNLALTLIQALHLYSYFFTPTHVPVTCSLGTGAQQNIIDCISCHMFEPHLSKLGGAEEGVLNLVVPKQSTEDKHLAMAIYRQDECYEFQCVSLHFPNDFNYEQPQAGETLRQLGFQPAPHLNALVSSSWFDHLARKLKGQENPEDIYEVSRVSNQNNTNSVMVRFRYISKGSTVQSLPTVVFHYARETIEHRLLFTLLFLLQVVSLKKIMADYNDLLRYALTVALLVSFVNELTIVLASLAAIFIALRLIVLEIEVTCYGAIALYLLATLLHWDSPNQLWLAVFNLALLARLSIHQYRKVGATIGLLSWLGLFSLLFTGLTFNLNYFSSYIPFLSLIVLLIGNEEVGVDPAFLRRHFHSPVKSKDCDYQDVHEDIINEQITCHPTHINNQTSSAIMNAGMDL